jgi:TolB-like protein/cytochrome c-type biogenesis protein CcmH/NrfG
LSLPAGIKLGPYEILSPLGAGGMGEVYRARDTKLDREVAVKVLPESLAEDPDALARFEREAKAVAALSHPNILAIHDYGTQDGIAYAVMELLSGQTLRDRLESGPIAQKQAVDLALQTARGLSAAHEKGIVHRDLKPENLFVTKEGHLKILDFGLAKRTEKVEPEGETSAPTASGHTTPGTVMGTVGYMSPEQLKGYSVDQRSDIFSFGAILYEMLSGRKAFKRETAAETTVAILTQEPPELSGAAHEISPTLDHILRHCLEKDSGNRFQTAKDIVFALSEASGSTIVSGAAAAVSAPGKRRGIIIAAAVAVVVVGAVVGFLLLRSGNLRKASPASPAAAAAHTIAVLPFANLSADKSQDYFADGISEDLLNLLTKIPQLQVTARTSSFYFKGKDVSIADIAKKLHVSHILEGSVQKEGSEVRITAQLVDVATNRQLWSQSYDRKLDDVFKIQDEIAADVVKQLKVKLLGAAPTVRPTDPKAYALYLQAKELARQATKEAYAKSDALYRQALAIDPRYAPAWGGLAENLYHESNIGLLSNREGYVRAREAAEKALAIDPDYAPAQAELGYIAMNGDNDLPGAAKHLERALALAPTDLDVLRNAAELLDHLGRLDESLALEEAVVRRDPVNVTAFYNLGYDQRDAGRFDAAIASFHTVLSLSPSFGVAHYSLGEALMLKGDAAGALAEMEQEKSDPWRMFGLPMAYHALGRKADSDRALAALIAKYEKDGSYNIAYVYAFRGEADKAFEWLDKAVEYKDPGLSEIVTENLFDKIHPDPRWLPFLRKLGKAPDQLAKIKFKVTLPADAERPN